MYDDTAKRVGARAGGGTDGSLGRDPAAAQVSPTLGRWDGTLGRDGLRTRIWDGPCTPWQSMPTPGEVPLRRLAPAPVGAHTRMQSEAYAAQLGRASPDVASISSPGGTGCLPRHPGNQGVHLTRRTSPAAAHRSGGCIACSQAFATAQRATAPFGSTSSTPRARARMGMMQQGLAPREGCELQTSFGERTPPYRGDMCRLDWVPVSILGLEQVWQFTTKTCNELAHDAATCTATQAHGPSAGCRSLMQYVQHGKRCLPPVATGLGLSDPTNLPVALQACEACGSSRRCCTWRSWQPLLRRRVRAVYLQCCSTADCLNTQPLLGAISHSSAPVASHVKPLHPWHPLTASQVPAESSTCLGPTPRPALQLSPHLADQCPDFQFRPLPTAACQCECLTHSCLLPRVSSVKRTAACVCTCVCAFSLCGRPVASCWGLRYLALQMRQAAKLDYAGRGLVSLVSVSGWITARSPGCCLGD
jgi:hypothetical protein